MSSDKLRLFISVVSVFAISCKRTAVPKLIPLDQLAHTQFSLTLESRFDTTKNVIYTPVFLYAWNNVRDAVGNSIVLTKSNSHDFSVLNKSESYKNSLEEDEYQSKTAIQGNDVSVSAFFNISVSFPYKLQKIEDGLIFDN